MRSHGHCQTGYNTSTVRRSDTTVLFDIREIIGGDHNAVQHSVSKLSMGQVAARIWTEVQKGKAKEMLLVAVRKCGRLGEKTSVV